jgi:hypothetical protein
MALFTDADLQGFADLGAVLLLNAECEILREVPLTTDSTGGHETIWPPVVDFTQWPVKSTEKCAVLYDNSPREPVGVAQQKVRRTPNKFFLSRGADVLETDRIRFDEEIFTITGIPVSSYEIFRTVSVARAPLQGSVS